MKSMLRVSIVALLGGLLLTTSYLSYAAVLTPGGIQFPAVVGAGPVGGTTPTTATVPFTSPVFSGFLTSSVLSGDTSNPFPNGLTFTYQFRLDPSSPHAVSQFTVSSFDSYQTDISFNPTSGGIAPTVASRSSEGGASGQVVRWTFLNPAVSGGQYSALLVVQTDATLFVPTVAALIDGQSVNVASFAPTVVPEPGVLALLLLGGLGFIARRKA